ncbi:hypothetical protein CRP01_05200 [Flavilitoribacter nigricans DSM 23189 = NBRC 102662]|uniref:Uncharacterized protein n=1 Tax=Flavilitoribacter nigricans (strain ATCC 23147 / DSM 23189 / NBRC 102662 / NCIMB 1420 / SS-2) TaxID=1122177 RepID=A0A2D0NH49_FLAN2|nr:hypothetical protein CRP01_05200 [Flavilitoribacter nigricans DSM 23189 = NBRC 102662]
MDFPNQFYVSIDQKKEKLTGCTVSFNLQVDYDLLFSQAGLPPDNLLKRELIKSDYLTATKMK